MLHTRAADVHQYDDLARTQMPRRRLFRPETDSKWKDVVKDSWKLNTKLGTAGKRPWETSLLQTQTSAQRPDAAEVRCPWWWPPGQCPCPVPPRTRACSRTHLSGQRASPLLSPLACHRRGGPDTEASRGPKRKRAPTPRPLASHRRRAREHRVRPGKVWLASRGEPGKASQAGAPDPI